MGLPGGAKTVSARAGAGTEARLAVGFLRATACANISEDGRVKHWVMWGMVGLLVLSGCDDDGGTDSDDPASGGGEVASKLATYSGAAQRAHEAAIDVVRVATSNFTVELDEVDPDVAEFDAALERALAAHAQWVASGWTLMGEPSASDAREDALFVPFGIALAGLAFTAVSGYIGLSKVTALRTGPVVDRIDNASDEELAVINRELGLPEDTSSEDAVEAFEDLGPGEQLAKAALIENAITNAVEEGVDGVDPIEESDRRSAISEAAVQAGETAVKATVSASTVATGGEGIVEVGRLLGASRELAIGLDLALSAAGTQDGVSSTPLGALGNHLTVAIQSQETTHRRRAFRGRPAAQRRGHVGVGDRDDTSVAVAFRRRPQPHVIRPFRHVQGVGMSRRRDALRYHSEGRPGKIAIQPTKPLQTQRDLSLAYTPGVAEPCLEIARDPDKVFDYTARGNLVAVVSNGTAVLGLGDIGPEASKPVMEGKGVLFKRFADIDVFDIEIAEKDPDKLIEVVAALEPTFGGINLEDIKAPECFYIEEKLRERLRIPVFHDDQHGTAIIAAAAFVNALEIVGKRAEEVRCVFSGAGAAAMACANLFLSVGVRPENLILCDSRGVIYTGRAERMNPYKERMAVDTEHRTLADAMVASDVFVGVSTKGVVSPEMLLTMASDPIVMAMANPDPEISYPDAVATRDDLIMATGRSDFPNQVNNVLGFPFIFRGALDVRATTINEEMKIAAVNALASLAREEVPDEVRRAYGDQQLRFGRDYIIPKPFDWRALLRVAPAVARAAMESGVARQPIHDFDAYTERLEAILGSEREMMRGLIRKARRDPPRIVFPEGDEPKVIRAAQICHEEGIAKPILVGIPEEILEVAAANEISMDGIEIVDALEDPRTTGYVEEYWRRRCREGVTEVEAARRMRRRNYFGSMMVACGDAEGFVSGMTRSYPDTIRPPLEIIGSADEHRVAGAYLVITSGGVKVFADTTVNIDPSADELAHIALATARFARRLDLHPRVAMLSFSNFGSNRSKQARKVADAVAIIRQRDPELDVDGEMQVGPAIDVEQRERLFGFSTLGGPANVLIFPELNSANIGYKLMRHLGGADVVGPVLIGMHQPVNVLERDCSVRSVVNMAAITAVQAQEMAKTANQRKWGASR